MVSVDLPPQIPAACIQRASEDYSVPALVILGVVAQESGGDPLAVGRNSNGTVDIGLTQFNYGAGPGSWLEHLGQYGIRPEDMFNPCQAVRATAYAIRVEANRSRCGGDFWCGVGYYHSPNQVHRVKYVSAVWRHVQRIQATGLWRSR